MLSFLFLSLSPVFTETGPYYYHTFSHCGVNSLLTIKGSIVNQ